MSKSFITPGVYIEEVPRQPPTIVAGATAIPAFIGYTQKAIDRNGNDLGLQPMRVASLTEYGALFGKAQAEKNLTVTCQEGVRFGNKDGVSTIAVGFKGTASQHNMYYALQAYFANGGGSCFIISVGRFKQIGQPLVLTELMQGLDALKKEESITLVLFPEGQQLQEQDYYALQNAALDYCGIRKNCFCIMDVFATGENLTSISDARNKAHIFRTGITSTHLKNGAAYFPNIRSTIPYVYTDGAVKIIHKVAGKSATFNNKSLAAIKKTNAALYVEMKKALNRFGIVLPSSPFIAGAYVSNDKSRGVWKAPANIHLQAGIELLFNVNDSLREELNVDSQFGKSINVIRSFTDKGILIWGARTLAGNDNEWRYISVRRFFNMVEVSCEKGIEQFMFERNDATTWTKVKVMIEIFLITLWQQGALQGLKPEQAFYVACGLNKTMTANDVAEGKLIVEVGMAVVRPAEFIIVRIEQKMISE